MTGSESAATPDAAHLEAVRAARGRIDRVNDWLQIGSALSPDDYGRLRDLGVTHLLDLREDDDAGAVALPALGIARRHTPVPNREAPTLEQLEEVATWFTGRDGHEQLYIHCARGSGRTGTMAIGLLVNDGLPLEEAEAQVRAARAEVALSESQQSWLMELEARRKPAEA